MARDPRRKGRPRRPSGQFRDAIRDEALWDLERKYPAVDWDAIRAITTGISVVYGLDGDQEDPELAGACALLHPGIDDQMEFDRRVCAAGLTDYFRFTMPEDAGAGCTPLDPRTMKPFGPGKVPCDRPTIAARLAEYGLHMRVTQAAPGYRIKRPWRLQIAMPFR